MAYQSAATGRPPVQESYGGFDPDSTNIGLSNSARGEGTTTSEVAAKLRFFNVATCAYLIVFHSLPIVINPIRWALLLTSPTRIVLEAIVGILALSMLITEARVPVLAEKVLTLFRKCSLGNVQLIDLDLARGRVVALFIMVWAIGTINHLNMHKSGHSDSGNESVIESDATEMTDDVQQTIIVNATNSSDILNETMTDIDDVVESINATPSYSSSSDDSFIDFLSAIIWCILLSPTMWILLALLSYTIYVIKEYPSYADTREFPHVQDGSSSSGSRPLSPTSARNWVGTIPDFSTFASVAGAAGYQSVDNPIRMNV